MKDITREEFAKFWDEKVEGKTVDISKYSISFSNICEKLGLKEKWKTFNTVDELVKWSRGKKITNQSYNGIFTNLAKAENDEYYFTKNDEYKIFTFYDNEKWQEHEGEQNEKNN